MLTTEPAPQRSLFGLTLIASGAEPFVDATTSVIAVPFRASEPATGFWEVTPADPDARWIGASRRSLGPRDAATLSAWPTVIPIMSGTPTSVADMPDRLPARSTATTLNERVSPASNFPTLYS